MSGPPATSAYRKACANISILRRAPASWKRCSRVNASPRTARRHHCCCGISRGGTLKNKARLFFRIFLTDCTVLERLGGTAVSKLHCMLKERYYAGTSADQTASESPDPAMGNYKRCCLGAGRGDRPDHRLYATRRGRRDI